MTAQEFNTKYKQYIPEGWYGLEFDLPKVTEYLNSVIEDGLCIIPGFEIHQIKLKFGMARFYFTTNIKDKHLEGALEFHIEEKINEIIKRINDGK